MEICAHTFISFIALHYIASHCIALHCIPSHTRTDRHTHTYTYVVHTYTHECTHTFPILGDWRKHHFKNGVSSLIEREDEVYWGHISHSNVLQFTAGVLLFFLKMRPPWGGVYLSPTRITRSQLRAVWICLTFAFWCFSSCVFQSIPLFPTGWRFQTFFLFSINKLYGIILPIDFHSIIFQDGHIAPTSPSFVQPLEFILGSSFHRDLRLDGLRFGQSWYPLVVVFHHSLRCALVTCF